MTASTGFSGTRYGMTDSQKAMVYQALLQSIGDFHHGDCIGADDEAHDIAHGLEYNIIIHPPLDPKLQAYKHSINIRPRAPYKARNKNIVCSSDRLIACPQSRNEKGGTWNAIGWARLYKKPTVIILPNGEAIYERWKGR